MKFINISLDLGVFSLLLWFMANCWISREAEFSRLIEFLGMISIAEVSPTNLMCNFQSDNSLSVITEKRITLSFVPRGTPSLRAFQSDMLPPILTA